jgi:hypothetical protein
MHGYLCYLAAKVERKEKRKKAIKKALNNLFNWSLLLFIVGGVLYSLISEIF